MNSVLPPERADATGHRLSVLVYSLDRHPFLRRQIVYWSDKPVDLLIADGSQKPLDVSTITWSGQMRLSYHNAPGPRNVNLRMKWLASHASTPYVVFVDDQDTCLWSAATRIMRFLDNNADYVSASASIFCRYEKYRFWSYDDGGFDIDHADPGARVVDAWRHNSPIARLAYAIMRAPVARVLYDARPVVDFDFEVASDLLFFVSPFIAGKHRAFTFPALWRVDGSQPRGNWRARAYDGNVVLDKRTLNDSIERLCVTNNVRRADHDAVIELIAGIWLAQESLVPKTPIEPTWWAARLAEVKSFTRIRSRIKHWLRKDRDIRPLEFFTRKGGLERDQIEDLQNLQSILDRYPDGVSATS